MNSQARGIVERLLIALEAKTQAQLAASLEIRPQSIISAMSRGEIPEAWLYRVAYCTGRSVEWLRTGKGPAWRGNSIAETTTAYGGQSSPLRRIIETWEELSRDEQQIVDRCVEVLRAGDPDLREHLHKQLKLIDEMQVRRGKRAGRRV